MIFSLFSPLSAIRHPAKVICIAEVMACPDLEESRGFCCHLQTGDAWARPLFCLCLPLGLNATTKLSCLQIFPGICQIGENSVTTTTEHSLSGLLGDWNQTKKKSNSENYRSRCLMHVQDKKDRVISLSVLEISLKTYFNLLFYEIILIKAFKFEFQHAKNLDSMLFA